MGIEKIKNEIEINFLKSKTLQEINDIFNQLNSKFEKDRDELRAQLDKYEEIVKLVKFACSNDCRDFTEAYDYLSQVVEGLEHEEM